jgi:hypothetical protein
MQQRLLTAFAFLLVPLAAQTFAVVPSKAARSQDGKWYSPWLVSSSNLGNTASHTQALYATSDIGVTAGTLNGLTFRRDNVAGTYAATTVNMTIDLSITSLVHSAASWTFASNHGPSRVNVFRGPVSVPARTLGSWPEPWESMIPFSTPMAYARSAGNSLVVDVVTTRTTTGNPWFAEAYAVGYGSHTVDLHQPNCLHSDGGASGGYGGNTFQPYPGGPFSLHFSGMPANVPSFHANRLVFGLRGVGGMLGPITLPVPFATLGIPSPANCQWSSEFLCDAPMTYQTGTQPNSGLLSIGTFTFPNMPRLVGQSFVTGGIALDTNRTTQQLEAFPTITLKWTIGTGDQIPASQVIQFLDTMPPMPTGQVFLGEAPVLQLSFQ